MRYHDRAEQARCCTSHVWWFFPLSLFVQKTNGNVSSSCPAVWSTLISHPRFSSWKSAWIDHHDTMYHRDFIILQYFHYGQNLLIILYYNVFTLQCNEPPSEPIVRISTLRRSRISHPDHRGLRPKTASHRATMVCHPRFSSWFVVSVWHRTLR